MNSELPAKDASLASFTAETAIEAVRAYNAGTYRGRSNVLLDRVAYVRFRNGLPRTRPALIDALRFVGEEYGGAQARFLTRGYNEEASIIAARLLPALSDFEDVVAAARRLDDEVPSLGSLTLLLSSFEGTKRWTVWATKTLHFIRPDAFPILDSRGKNAVGLRNIGGSARDYRRFCINIREVLHANAGALAAARAADAANSPSDLKLLDKILYQLG